MERARCAVGALHTGIPSTLPHFGVFWERTSLSPKHVTGSTVWCPKHEKAMERLI